MRGGVQLVSEVQGGGSDEDAAIKMQPFFDEDLEHLTVASTQQLAITNPTAATTPFPTEQPSLWAWGKPWPVANGVWRMP